MIITTQQKTTSALVEVACCYYCGGKDLIAKFYNVKDRLQMLPAEWQFLQCINCKAVILSPRPEASDLEKLYPEHYTFNVKEACSQQKRWLSRFEYWLHYHWIYKAQATIALRLAGVRHTSNVKLLDIGCGSGFLLRAFKKKGLYVEGIDTHVSAVSYVQKVLNIPARLHNAQKLSEIYPSDSWDIITLFHLLEHVPNPIDLVAQCYATLKPGGALVIGVPLIDSVQVRLLGARSCTITEAPRHLSIPSQNSIIMMCKKLNFVQLRWHADSMINCASHYGLSFFPVSATTQQYGKRKFHSLLHRCLGALAVYLCIPLVGVENKILKRPIAGIFVALKPH